MSIKYLLNDLWQFTKQELGTTLQTIKSNEIQWNFIDLPHDWLIYQTTNLYESSEGWYKRTLSKDHLSPSHCYSLRFDGVYMDSSIYINGRLACEWKYGYSTFEFDITDFLTESENEILVKVVYQSPNSRWYTGAGIYRNVWLIQYPATHITSDGVYICPTGLPSKTCTIAVKPRVYTRGISASTLNYLDTTITDGTITDIPIRKLELVTQNGTHLTKENPSTKVYLRKSPINTTYSDIAWRLTDSKGIDSTLAKLMIYEDHVSITALYNGRVYLRCSCKNGSTNIRLLSQLEFDITDLPDSSLDPYHFISAGLYTLSNLDLTNGNERGVATARDLESHVGFEQVDFGDYGSDEITIPIFSLDSDPLPLEIWKGMKGEQNSELLASVIYQKTTIWNIYQEETFRLNRRIKGRATISLVVNKKVHIKGFIFTKKERAFQRLYGTDCDSIYGDTFSYHNTSIVNIGNNVTIEFSALDFGLTGVTCLSIYGKSLTECNSIQLRMITANETYQELLEFPFSDTSIERKYSLLPITGITTVQLIFLPGCNFDLDWVQFQ